MPEDLKYKEVNTKELIGVLKTLERQKENIVDNEKAIRDELFSRLTILINATEEKNDTI